MATSMRDPAPQLHPDDYERINRILNDAEGALVSMAATHRLLGTKIDRWRWDIPEVVISWGNPHVEIGRNIRVLVQKERPLVFHCTFDVNAWQDDQFIANQTLRKWKNQTAGETDVSESKDQSDARYQEFTQLADRSYRIVSEWTLEILDQGTVF